MIRALIAITLLWNFVMTTAHADVFQGNNDGYTYEERGVHFRYWAAVNVSTLVGEPIVDARVRWEIDAFMSEIILPSFREEGAEDQTVRLSILANGDGDFAAPMNVWPKIYNFKLAFVFNSFNSSASPISSNAMIIADVGVLGAPDGQEWSFNISGSPDWDEFLVRGQSSSDIENPRYLREDDAKDFIQNMELVAVKIVEINVSFYDIQNWYAENSPYAQLPGIQYAYRRLKNAVERIAGYELPTTFFEDELISTAGSLSTLRAAVNGTGLLAAEQADIEMYREVVARLYNLPDEFLDGANAARFRREADRARENGNRLVREARTFQSTETDVPSPNADPVRSTEFPLSSYSFDWHQGLLDEQGRPVLKLQPNDTQLFDGTFLAIFFQDSSYKNDRDYREAYQMFGGTGKNCRFLLAYAPTMQIMSEAELDCSNIDGYGSDQMRFDDATEYVGEPAIVFITTNDGQYQGFDRYRYCRNYPSGLTGGVFREIILRVSGAVDVNYYYFERGAGLYEMSPYRPVSSIIENNECVQ